MRPLGLLLLTVLFLLLGTPCPVALHRPRPPPPARPSQRLDWVRRCAVAEAALARELELAAASARADVESAYWDKVRPPPVMHCIGTRCAALSCTVPPCRALP